MHVNFYQDSLAGCAILYTHSDDIMQCQHLTHSVRGASCQDPDPDHIVLYPKLGANEFSHFILLLFSGRAGLSMRCAPMH